MKKVLLFSIAGLLCPATMLAAALNASDAKQVEIGFSERHDTSPPLRDMIKSLPQQAPKVALPGEEEEIPNIFLSPLAGQNPADVPNNPFVQRAPTGDPTPSPIMSFTGINNIFGVLPPDTNGDVGISHYIQYINLGWAIFDKATGLRVDIPGDADDILPGNSFWTGFGGPCETNNSGDPIVLWDKTAQRWVFSQFTGSAQPRQCFAISTTADPLGPYHRYAFTFPNFNDYPHIGIWQDKGGSRSGYYFVVHEFSGQSFVGAGFVAVDRNRMLVGQPSAFVRFGSQDAFGALPPHQEGFELPAQGTCAPFVHFDAGTDEYRFWDLCVNWDFPTQSTLSTEQRVSAAAPFDSAIGGIPQMGSAQALDSFPSNLMYRASTRTFPAGGPTETSMVITHSVNVGGGQAGVRWVHFELPNQDEFLLVDGMEDSGPGLPAITTQKRLIDEGTYAPDAANRWMGAIAMDQNGNIGLGYTRSSDSESPKILLAGRELNDEPGTLRNEVACTPAMTGSQTSTSGRWGDYASTSVDPVDDCTFWHTNEFYATTSSAGWTTRICSFRFPNCGTPEFTLITEGAPRATICFNEADPSVNLRVASVAGFTGPVTLSGSNVPAGLTLSFGTNPVQAPGSTAVTLTGANALASGEYDFFFVGDSGMGINSRPFSLGVSDALPAQPTLTSPSPAQTGVKVRPTLTWNSATSANEYFVELATDAGFANVIASTTTTGTSFSPAVPLNSMTQYFWRVTASNYCGAGTTSAASSFTTGTPGTCPAGSTPGATFSDDFQGGTNGWTTNAPVGPSNWVQAAAPGGIGMSTTVWFATNPPNPGSNNSSDQRLVSPAIALPSTNVVSTFLSYDTFHNFEQDPPSGCWDAGQLEISTDGGSSWTQISDNQLFTDPYTGQITPNPDNPNSGTPGWCVAPGNTALNSIVDLDAYAGQSIRLRYRVVTDGNTAATGTGGFFIDNLEITSCTN